MCYVKKKWKYVQHEFENITETVNHPFNDP